MKKWFASNEAKKITVIILILCAALIIQITGVMHLNKKLYTMSLEHSVHQVEELSVYIEKALYIELEHHIHLLKMIATQFEKEDCLFSDKMCKHLEEVYHVTDFKLMGISDLDGNGIDFTGKKYDISYDHIREYMENNQVYISNVLKDKNETLIFIAVPLEIDGEISGILWGKHALADIIDNLKFPDTGHKYFQIIDDKGHYLLSSQNQFSLSNDPQHDVSNIWEEMESHQYPTGTSVEEIHEKVQKGETGNFYFEGNGQGCYVSYRPLEINNWYLFSVQEDDELHDFVYRTREIAGHFFLVLSIGLLAIFGVIYNLTYTMYKKIVKQNRDIQAINAMFRTTLQQTKNVPFSIDQNLKQISFYGYPTKDIVQRCSFEDMQPENMIRKGLLDKGSLEEYKKLYQCLILQKKKCDPTIIYSKMGGRKEWIRVSITSYDGSSTEPMIGVLENYGEQKEKELQIETHLDDIKRIQKKSKIDFLTNLYNREAFLEKIQVALDKEDDTRQLGAFLILDLDYFKEVNDCMGHGMGDIVLQKTANTLSNFFRKDDIVGRLGGDEFVIFAQNIRDVRAFERRIKELNRLLCKVYQKDGNSVQVSASIGIVLTDTNHATFNDLYEKADQALYKVKHTGRNAYQIYSENK